MADHGRKNGQVESSLGALRRRLLGYVSELQLPNGIYAVVEVRMPYVESSAWLDAIEAAAVSGLIPYSKGWRTVERDALMAGVYPPPGSPVWSDWYCLRKLDLRRPRWDGRPGVTVRTDWAEQVWAYQLRGKLPCRRCGVPAHASYCNAQHVCFDCQCDQAPPGRGSALLEAARRGRAEESGVETDGYRPPHELMEALAGLNLTTHQIEVSRMWVQGFSYEDIADMTHRSVPAVRMMLKRVRGRLRKKGLRPLVRFHHTGSTRHVRLLRPSTLRRL